MIKTLQTIPYITFNAYLSKTPAIQTVLSKLKSKWKVGLILLLEHFTIVYENVTQLWIPGHCGIPENELVDMLVKERFKFLQNYKQSFDLVEMKRSKFRLQTSESILCITESTLTS